MDKKNAQKKKIEVEFPNRNTQDKEILMKLEELLSDKEEYRF